MACHDSASRIQLYGVDDSGACAKFRTAEAREKGCAAMSMEEKAARMSQYTDSRGGMMMVYAVPVVVHIVRLTRVPLHNNAHTDLNPATTQQMAWDLALRQIPEYPELFQSNFAAPDMGIYHYLIGTLLGLHLLRRFVEVLFIHEYTADIKLSTVISLGAQSAVDVALMDYYLFNTALDFAGGGWNVFVWGGVGLWITGQMGAMKHHWLLCMTRGPGAPGDLAAAAQSHGTPNQANAPAALETVKGGGGGSAKKKAKIISRRAKASVAEAPQDVAVAKTTATMASTNGYVSPQLIGGMFDTIACPHYMYEACTWLGMAVLARHIFSWALAVQVPDD